MIVGCVVNEGDPANELIKEGKIRCISDGLAYACENIGNWKDRELQRRNLSGRYLGSATGI